jgi:DNA invertase Pin-like site-specific DNA recombinase
MAKTKVSRVGEQVRALGYLRVSTEEQAGSGAGLDAQADAIATAVAGRNWVLLDTVIDAGVSGGKAIAQRAGLCEVLQRLDAGEADVLIVSKLDRLSRSVRTLCELLDHSEAKGWSLVILDTDLDTTSASGRLVASVMGSVAEWERRVIAERTKAALSARKARGKRLGRPVVLAEATRARIAALHAAGTSQAAIARQLTAEAVETATGKTTWYPATVRNVLLSLDLDAEAASRQEAN